jgi:hypothetical protein
MTTTRTILVAAAALAWTSGIALAHHTPCCEGKACPTGETAVAGGSPETAQCCADPADATTCHTVPNAGWACSGDAAANASAIPDRGAVAGCAQDEVSSSCTGGAITPAGASGCVGVGGLQFIAGANPSATAADCTNAAVDACCANAACEPFVDEE